MNGSVKNGLIEKKVITSHVHKNQEVLLPYTSQKTRTVTAFRLSSPVSPQVC